VKWMIGALGTLCVAATPLSALAANADGDYAVSGAGSQSCERFVTAVEQNDESAALFTRWIEGYATGLNANLDETFDVSPFASANPLTQLTLWVCRNNTEALVEQALAEVIVALEPVKTREASEPREMSHQGESVMVRPATLRLAQQRLTTFGHYASTIDGLYGPGTRRALIAFQEEAGLDTTGLPDAATLIALLINQDDN